MVLTLEDLKDQKLTIRRLINEHPDLILEAYYQANSYTHLLGLINVTQTNTSARESIKQFLVEQNLPLIEYSGELSQAYRKLTLDEVKKRFVKGDTYYGTALRKWVIQFNLLPYHCKTDACPLHDANNLVWNGEKITLDLDHINGDNKDNRLENLRFLCPNCHSQTETYKGLNNNRLLALGIARPKRTSTKVLAERVCPSCHGEKSARSKECENCYTQPTKVSYPPLEKLIAQIKSSSFEAVGRSLGVSGNAVRKHLRRNEYDPKSL